MFDDYILNTTFKHHKNKLMLNRKNTFMIMAIGISALFAMSCQKSSQDSQRLKLKRLTLPLRKHCFGRKHPDRRRKSRRMGIAV